MGLENIFSILLFVPRLVWEIVSKFSWVDIFKILVLLPFYIWVLHRALAYSGHISAVARAYQNFFDNGLVFIREAWNTAVELSSGQLTEPIKTRFKNCQDMTSTNMGAYFTCMVLPALA